MDYKESPTSKFTHNDRAFNLNIIFKNTVNHKVVSINVSDLKWILEENGTTENAGWICQSCLKRNKEPHQKRVNDSDLKVPILVTMWNGKMLVVDGIHRLEKALLNNIEMLPAIILSDDDLKVAEYPLKGFDGISNFIQVFLQEKLNIRI